MSTLTCNVFPQGADASSSDVAETGGSCRNENSYLGPNSCCPQDSSPGSCNIQESIQVIPVNIEGSAWASNAIRYNSTQTLTTGSTAVLRQQELLRELQVPR